MSAKILNLPCSPNLSAIMAAAVAQYVAVQYPPGSGDCALTAREALLDVVEKINQTCATQTTVLLSRRLRSLMKVAVNFYCEQRPEVENLETLRELLLEALYEKRCDDALLVGLRPDKG